MGKWVKRGLLGVAGLAAVLAAAAVLAPRLIPASAYKDQIARRVEEATGREMTIDGAVRVSILPSIQLVLGDVAVSNAAWAERDTMASLAALRVRVEPWALLGGEIAVTEFILDAPTIHLAAGPEGQRNWVFDPPADRSGQGDAAAGQDQGSDSRDTATNGSGQGTSAGGVFGGGDVSLGDVRLVDGTVTYTDLATGRSQTVSDVDLALALANLDAAFRADGELTWQGEPWALTLATGPPRDLMAARATPVDLALEGDPLTVSFDGRVTATTPVAVDGAVTLTAAPRRLAELAGQPLALGDGALDHVHLDGSVSAAEQTYKLTAEALELDAMAGKGTLALDLAGAKPAVSGDLDWGELDLRPYLASDEASAGEAADGNDTAGSGAGGDASAGEGERASSPAGEADGAGGWSRDRFDLSPLKAANADLALAVDGLKAPPIALGTSALAVTLTDGRLVAALDPVTLYGGDGAAEIVVDARKAPARLAGQANLADVAVQPLLAEAADFERLSGTAALSLDMAARGQSPQRIVASLNGTGEATVRDGAIAGLELPAMMRQVEQAWARAGGAGKTPFAHLSATVSVTDGVAANDDLVLLSPLLRARGAGQADLPARTVDYTVTPKAVASTVGQGGDLDRPGVALPVRIHGPWTDLAYTPQPGDAVANAVMDAQGLKDELDGVLDELGAGADLDKALEGALTGGSSEDQAADAVDAVEEEARQRQEEATEAAEDEAAEAADDLDEEAEQLRDEAEDAVDSLLGN